MRRIYMLRWIARNRVQTRISTGEPLGLYSYSTQFSQPRSGHEPVRRFWTRLGPPA